MKKLIKKIEFKPLLISIGLVLFQTTLFFSAKLFQSNPNEIGNIIDEKIPFCNLFIIPYCIWYILIFVVPYYFYKKDKNTLLKYVSSYVLCAIVADIIFIVYPTTIVRPELANNNILNIITNIVYFFDTPALNCLPSLHCAVSMLFILTCISSKKVNNNFKIPIIIISLLVMIGTLFVKQHVFIDLVTGDLLMFIIFIIVSNSNKLLNFTKKLLKI